jgi:uncharacterized damage-inducible protein DinB
MLPDVLRAIFRRDLEKLATEITIFRQEENIWRIGNGISNSAGNLCLHLIGNLNTYIGAGLGNTAYVRDREAEFSLKNIPAAVLLKNIADTMVVVDTTLQQLTGEEMDKDYPMLVFEKKTTVGYFLVHLATHLSYHLGQINYCRRLLESV